MFWGLALESGKRYTQTVENSFHISMAALEPATGKAKQEATSVMINAAIDKSEFMLCSLEAPHTRQQALDLNFTEGEEITFLHTGPGVVHLTGYLVPEEEHPYAESDMSEPEDSDEEEEEDSDEDSDDDEEAPKLLAIEEGMRKVKAKDKGIAKKLKLEEDDEEEEENEDEDEEMESDDEDDTDEEDDDEDEEEDSDEDEDDSDEDLDMSGSFVQEPKPKRQKIETPEKTPPPSSKKKDKQKPEAKKPGSKKSEAKKPEAKKAVKKEEPTPIKVEPATNGEAQSDKKKKKKKKNKNKDGEASQPSTPSQKSPQQSPATKSPAPPKSPGAGKKLVLAGGVIAEDVKQGHGPEAKAGKTVHVYYAGKLQSGKQFDACLKGKPFKFKLGKQEVIKGWDNGVAGMKVGGKRKLTIPPSQAYGSQKMGPIPGNSTLMFEVELKAVS